MKKVVKGLYILVIKVYYKVFYSLTLGKDAVMHAPKKLEGGRYIHIGDQSFVGADAWLATFDEYQGEKYKPSIKIAERVSIGRYACITAIDEVYIDKGCLISEFFYVSDHTHGYDPVVGQYPADQKLYSKGKVYIGEGCFIGYRVCVMPGVRIGKGCVIGSNSVVTKSLPDYAMAAGVPAKIIKTFNFNTKAWEPYL